MSEAEATPFTIEQFYRFMNEGKLMGAKCIKCGKIMLPPRPICIQCYSENLEWIKLENKGKLLTYTIIHVAPPQFQHLVPYAVGIIELEKGLKLPGMIKGIDFDKIKIGMELKIEVEPVTKEEAEGQEWPTWPKYYFKPA
ncbi:Zn-ribbon domain-containing OB-fold protein [Candidatus Bathyarchaeota archaeon]|nr:Zn-ribbon domain-containing OB-fold protein [Candidatus Bathyarchaeota archaeon]